MPRPMFKAAVAVLGLGLLVLLITVVSGCGPSGRPVPGYPGMTYTADRDVVSGQRVAFAVREALGVLGRWTRWDAGAIERAVTPVHIHVVDDVVVDRTTNAGGYTWETMGEIAVPRSMHQLAHEFLHLAIYRLTGVADYGHADPSWAAQDVFEVDFRRRMGAAI